MQPVSQLVTFIVTVMILLQAYLYIYSFLTGVTFEVLPLSNYELSPMMLPPLETFMETCCGIAFNAVDNFLGGK
jgi:hypothetical protein